MDYCRKGNIPLPALKLPPPNIVTDSPPMSPLAKESSKMETHNKNMRRNFSTAQLNASQSTTRPSALLNPTCPGSPISQRKLTLSAPGKSFTSPSTGLTSLTPTHLKPAGIPLNRSTSDPGPKKSNRRVNLGPGCGPLDWIRLCRNTKDMAGTGGEELTVTEEELAKHSTMDDAWTCIRGKVYNITPYFKFHPGGKEDLLKAAGKDSTILFDEVHKWVNCGSLLKKCFVGNMSDTKIKRTHADSLNIPKQLVVTDGMNRQAVSKRMSESSDEALVHSPQSPVHPPIQLIVETDSPAVVVEPPSPIRKNSDASRPVVTLWDWTQTNETVSLQVFIHNNKSIVESDIIVDADGHNFEASIRLGSWIYQMGIELQNPVKDPAVFLHSNKVDIRLSKVKPNDNWTSIGRLLPTHNQMVSENNKVPKFRTCTIRSIKDVTHDSRIFSLDIPPSCLMSVPVGHHVSIRPSDPAVDIERSYTPVRSLPVGHAHSLSSNANNNNSTAVGGNTIELMIKLYKDGTMSQHLAKLSPGDQLQVGDPQGTFDASRLASVTDVLLVAAGTGFTPMVRVLNQLFTTPSTAQTGATESLSLPVPAITATCTTATTTGTTTGTKDTPDTSSLPTDTSVSKKVHLLFANKTTKDIIWRKDLDDLAKKQDNFTVTHILSSPDDSWKGLTGRVSSDLLKSYLPKVPPSDEDQKNVLVCVCGPQPFTTSIMDTVINMDYPDNCIHVFQ